MIILSVLDEKKSNGDRRASKKIEKNWINFWKS